MSEQTIQSQDIKIADVFQSFYVVPDYQREYVWETEPVEQLLSDIYGELAGVAPADAPEYFIGSIVVCPSSNGVLNLIDGQQRMTTLFLTLCAIRDRFRTLSQSPPGGLDPQIPATAADAAGNDLFRYRLELQYKDSGEVLQRIAKGEVELASETTRSVRNILKAYRVITSFLRREFGDDPAHLRLFYGYLINKVKLIRIQTENVAKALKVFETINDRGIGLDAMDLLKNLLFMKAEHREFDELKTIWKQMQDTIYGINEKPLRFLRYFIFSRYDVDLLREDQIYDWLSKNEAECRYGTAPLLFAQELLAAAQAYKGFLAGVDPRGEKNRFLQNLQILGGKAARQHLILLLAGRHLPEALFNRLAIEVENLFFVYVVTREATRDFERSFARWATDLRKITSNAEFETFIQGSFTPVKAQLAERFGEAIRRLDVGAVQQYRLRYILAKLTQHVDLQAYGETEWTRWLHRYMENDFEIEHIFPQAPSEEAKIEFGSASDPNIANRLGNLVLVEKSINASLGNKSFSRKRSIYSQSKLLLTRSVSERPKVGSSTKIDVAVSRLDPFPEWNEDAVLRRAELIQRLASTIWCVPEKA